MKAKSCIQNIIKTCENGHNSEKFMNFLEQSQSDYKFKSNSKIEENLSQTDYVPIS